MQQDSDFGQAQSVSQTIEHKKWFQNFQEFVPSTASSKALVACLAVPPLCFVPSASGPLRVERNFRDVNWLRNWSSTSRLSRSRCAEVCEVCPSFIMKHNYVAIGELFCPRLHTFETIFALSGGQSLKVRPFLTSVLRVVELSLRGRINSGTGQVFFFQRSSAGLGGMILAQPHWWRSCRRFERSFFHRLNSPPILRASQQLGGRRNHGCFDQVEKADDLRRASL